MNGYRFGGNRLELPDTILGTRRIVNGVEDLIYQWETELGIRGKKIVVSPRAERLLRLSLSEEQGWFRRSTTPAITHLLGLTVEVKPEMGPDAQVELVATEEDLGHGGQSGD